MSEKEQTLVPVEQREVEFYGDEVTAVRLEDGTVYVPVRPIIEAVGVDWNGQRRRMMRDAVLAKHVLSVDVTSTQGSGPPQRRATLCLPLKYLSGFLFGINADRVRADLREKVMRFQEECYDVLAEAFQEGRLTADPSFDDLLQQASKDLVDAYSMAQALVKLARNQIMLESQIGEHGRMLSDHGRRLETIEAELHDEARYITESQATQVGQAVRAIALEMSRRSGRNEYGATWGEFYRRFDVAKYRHLPAARFDEAMDWLSNWYKDLTGEEPF